MYVERRETRWGVAVLSIHLLRPRQNGDTHQPRGRFFWLATFVALVWFGLDDMSSDPVDVSSAVSRPFPHSFHLLLPHHETRQGGAGSGGLAGFFCGSV